MFCMVVFAVVLLFFSLPTTVRTYGNVLAIKI